MYKKMMEELTTFIKKSPTAFHAVSTISEKLKDNGFTELSEGQEWNLQSEGRYYVTRNQSSIIAFRIGDTVKEATDYSFQIAASHSDSPTFKLKENALVHVKDKYTILNTEGYGGMLCSTWFDRPLSIAGRVIVKEGNHFHSRLVNVDRDLLMIPSLAIHMNRDANSKQAFNKQKDMQPIFGGSVLKPEKLKEVIAEELGVKVGDIYGSDLFLYNRMQPSVWGAQNEFVSCAQLDDLQCAYASLHGFLNEHHAENISVYVCFDNEEVGSGTKQGAASTFLLDVLKRVNAALGKNTEDYRRALASGFMLSCDNAHAVHPNYTEKTDKNNCVFMNEGIVIKSHAGQKYTSDAISMALFKEICKRANAPVQYFSNRSDMIGGSTLGNIAMSQVSINTVDIGLPQLAMHSAYETAGVKDTKYMIDAISEFYKSRIIEVQAGEYILE